MTTWVASKDFTFGEVKFREGDLVPCQMVPYAQLLNFGGFYVQAVNHDQPEAPS